MRVGWLAPLCLWSDYLLNRRRRSLILVDTGKSRRDPEALPYPDTWWLIAEGDDDGTHNQRQP